MYDLPDEFNLDNEKLSITELYEFELTNGRPFYYTSFGEDILWGSQLYMAIPIQRSEISQKLNLEFNTCQINMGIIGLVFRPAGWISPNDWSGASWANGQNAYDGDRITTWASCSVPAGQWGGFIEFTLPPADCDRIRVFNWNDTSILTLVDVDVWYDGEWHHAYQGSYTTGSYKEIALDDVHTISKVRIRYWNNDPYDPETALVSDIGLYRMASYFADNLQKNLFDGTKVTIKRIAFDGDAGAGFYSIRFVGRASASYNRREMTLDCVSIFDSLNVSVPRNIYKEPCNNRLFDSVCGLTKSDYKYEGTATEDSTNYFTLVDDSLPCYSVAFDAGDSALPIEIGDTITGGTNSYTAVVVSISYVTSSTGYIYYVDLSNSANFENDEELSNGSDTVVVNGTPAEDAEFYQLGEVEITLSDNDGVRRMIRTVTGNTIYFAVAVPYLIGKGVTFDLYPGCDFKPETCRNKFNNDDNFVGYVYIAKPEEALYGQDEG